MLVGLRVTTVSVTLGDNLRGGSYPSWGVAFTCSTRNVGVMTMMWQEVETHEVVPSVVISVRGYACECQCQRRGVFAAFRLSRAAEAA
jgi:hypothetical protein